MEKIIDKKIIEVAEETLDEEGYNIPGSYPGEKKTVTESICILALTHPFHPNDDRIQEGFLGIYNVKPNL